MSSARSHPIRILLDAAAGGHTPTATEVTAITAAVTEGMTSRDRELWRRRLEQDCRTAAAHYAEGEMGLARRHARSAAADLADQLDAGGAEAWSPPYDGPTAPADIVNAIPRY